MFIVLIKYKDYYKGLAKMISKGDNGTGTEAPPPKPLSFSISRILGQTDTHRATTTTTEHARTSSVLADEERQYPDDSFPRASVLSRDGDYRVPQLHASTVHHFAPYAHTDGYSHFGRFHLIKYVVGRQVGFLVIVFFQRI